MDQSLSVQKKSPGNEPGLSSLCCRVIVSSSIGSFWRQLQLPLYVRENGAADLEFAFAQLVENHREIVVA